MNIRLKAWFRQFLLFITALMLVKIVVVTSLEAFPFIVTMGEWLLSPLKRTGDTRLEVVVVMLLFPLVMNVMQAWLVDMIIKGKLESELRGLPYDEEDFVESEDNLVGPLLDNATSGPLNSQILRPGLDPIFAKNEPRGTYTPLLKPKIVEDGTPDSLSKSNVKSKRDK